MCYSELGVSEELAQSSIRLSIGRFTQKKDVERAIEILSDNSSIIKK